MELLIVGGSSFIGKNLIEKAPKDWKIKATYCNSENFREFAEKNNVGAIKVDVTQKIIPKLEKADALVYMPTITPGQLRNDPNALAKVYDVNAEGVNRVIDVTDDLKRIVYLSTGAVYLRNAAGNTLEYRKAKLAGEANAIGAAQEKGAEFVIMRNMETYGKYLAKHKIYRKLMESCLSGEKSFKVDSHGKNLLDTMYIDDYINGLIKAISDEFTSLTAVPFSNGCYINNRGLIVDSGRGRPVSLIQLAETIAKVCGNLEFKLECGGGKPTEETNFSVDENAFAQAFNVVPKTSLEEGLRKWKDENLL